MKNDSSQQNINPRVKVLVDGTESIRCGSRIQKNNKKMKIKEKEITWLYSIEQTEKLQEIAASCTIISTFNEQDEEEVDKADVRRERNPSDRVRTP